MLNQSNNYTLLVKKLDQFIRKFYVNQIIKGFLFSVAVILLLFLAFSILENQFYFSQGVRKTFFFSFLGISLAAIGIWIVKPMLNYFSLGKTISHEQAASIVGEHFTDVKDKLLNILQLKKQSQESSQAALIEASINQKADKLKIVPFKSAIDLGKNKQYMKYALPPFLILLVMLFAAPSIIKDGTHRILNNNKDFERAAPFHFKMAGDDLKVVQYEDFTLDVEVEGEVLPNEVFINIDDYQYRLNKKANNSFSYTFKNVQKSLNFNLFSGSVNSESKNLEVLLKPNMVDFAMQLYYPKYLNRKSERLENIGDAIVPVGTRIKWDFSTLNTDKLAVRFTDKGETKELEKLADNSFGLSKGIYSDQSYSVFLSNQYIPQGDSLSYNLSVIPDQHPSINVQQFQDSLEETIIYFVGNASDDYGLTTLKFNYTISNEDGSQKAPVIKTLKTISSREAQYDHLFDIEELKLAAGQSVSYYFEVFDNDGVNGAKSAKTGALQYSKASIEELEDKEDENEEDIKKDLEESIKESKKIQDKLKKMREKLLQENEMDWKDKKELEKLMEEQKKLEKKFEDAKKKFDENLENQDKISKKNEELLQKQEKLQEMFNEVLNQETKDLMEKIQELMQDLQKDQALEMMEEMQMDDKTLEKEMDRLLELYKQLEVEKEIQETIEKLEEMAEKQEEIAEQTENEEKPTEELKKEQEELNEEFEELKEEIEELEEKNEELEYPKELGEENEEDMEDIKEDMDESSEEMEKKDSKKASKAGKSAASKMKAMAGKMKEASESGEQEQMEEDIKALRQLLENIVDLSFDQETLINRFKSTSINTPRYVDLVRDQFKIKNDFKMVEDSLQELSKRVTQIESFVTEKVTEINYNIDASIEKLEARQKPVASQNQRYSMTNLNDLALMLAESMEQMQQQMSGMMAGDQMCDNPGKGKSGKKGKGGRQPMDKITEGQGELSKQLKGMMEGMQKGDKGSSKQFAEAAAKQAALRKMLEDAKRQGEEQGEGVSKELQEAIDKMDQNEIDLVNKRLNNEMMKRQNDIMTRLLKAEKAEREREYDNKRKAEVAQNKKRELPPSLEEYIKKKESEIEMYKTISPSLKPYYKYLIDNYFKELKEGK